MELSYYVCLLSSAYGLAVVSAGCENQFQCRDGSCVDKHKQCNGQADCLDWSDETMTSCRGKDRPFWNLVLVCGKPEVRRTLDDVCPVACAVNPLDCWRHLAALTVQTPIIKDPFQCRDGRNVDGHKQCNGEADCLDWSDETMTSCRGIDRPFLYLVYACGIAEVRRTLDDVCPVACAIHSLDCWQHLEALTVQTPIIKPPSAASCAYPRVILHGRVSVNGEINLINNTTASASHGSDLRFSCDEWYDLIGKSKVSCQSGNWSDDFPTCVRSTSDRCILPEHPEHGRYTVPSKNNSRPGDHFEAVYLSYECDAGYELLGHNIVTCHRGTWAPDFPTCTKLCKLNPHPSVSYKCHLPSNYSGFRPCNLYERNGTLVTPECNSPDYYHTGVLKIMTCKDDDWDYVAICEPECGRVTPNGVPMEIGGRSAKQGELPWHAGIYKKTVMPYEQICGGSLVSTTMVISAAHCFWNHAESKVYPATNYAVGLGKIYRPWANARDEGCQTFDVLDVKTTPRFRGSETLFQEDIALVILNKPAEYRHHVRPVCIDFDINFERRQLEDGKKGKIAGWGLKAEHENAPSQVLQVLELPIVSFSECIDRVSSSFRQYITSDKFCAGYWTEGKALCRGDSGGGLAFAESERSMERYYLRGVASTVDKKSLAHCNAGTVTTFSMISRHEQFIKQNLRI